MSGLALPPRQTRAPALVAAVLLHAGVLALVMIVPARQVLPPVGSSVPINIVSSAPYTDTRPAIQAPQPQEAAAPEPEPEAPPQPPAPVRAPPAVTEAAPPKAKVVKPVTPQPAVTPRPVATPTPQVDFNRLQQIIAAHQTPGGVPTSSAARGPARAETAPQARPDAGKGLSQSDLVGLQQLLERLWNPNCDVVGGSSVKLQVKFTVGFTGALLGRPSAGGAEHSSDPVVSAAARRALDAVQQATPYAPSYYGQPITVNFDAKEACAKR